MRFKFFQANDGDCLLLSSADGRNMLIDGGRSGSFETHTIPELGQMRERGEQLDVVYVSHIDNDHISGVLKLMDVEVEWRAFDFQRASRPNLKPPKLARPPEIGALWHNSFRDTVGDNAGPIGEQLAFTMKVVGVEPKNHDTTDRLENLVTGIREGLRLSHVAKPEVLGIPLNPPARGKVMLAKRRGRSIPLGSMNISILGPTSGALEDLRDEWNEFLRENREAVEELRHEALAKQERLGQDEGTALREAMLALAGKLGARADVTVPNLASLMLLVEEDDGARRRRILLTGDGHTDDVIQGLEGQGLLADDSGLHVDVLKVPHHGAAANFQPDFARRVTANHYVFCGNGSHSNPEKKVLKEIIDARLGGGRGKSRNPEADCPFTLWFSSSEAQANTESRKKHMAMVERYVLEERGGVEVSKSLRRRQHQRHRGSALRRELDGRMKAFFLRDESVVPLPEL